MDKHLIATPTYDDSLSASVMGVASKFAESPVVKYKCSISFCRKGDEECEHTVVSFAVY